MDPFNSGAVDLTNPAAVARECRDLAGGMTQQAQAAASGTAMAGHPNTAYFYAKVAAALDAASRLLMPATPPPVVQEGGAEPPVPPPAAESGVPQPPKKAGK